MIYLATNKIHPKYKYKYIIKTEGEPFTDRHKRFDYLNPSSKTYNKKGFFDGYSFTQIIDREQVERYSKCFEDCTYYEELIPLHKLIKIILNEK